MRFRANVELGGKTATGIRVPDEVIEALGSSKRPAVLVTVAGHTYPTTAARMNGSFIVPLNAENRAAAGLAAGDEVDVDIVLDQTPREIAVPDDLTAAFDDEARTAYEQQSYTHRKEWVRWIEEAKRPETRAKRVAQTVIDLKAGRKPR